MICTLSEMFWLILIQYSDNCTANTKQINVIICRKNLQKIFIFFVFIQVIYKEKRGKNYKWYKFIV